MTSLPFATQFSLQHMPSTFSPLQLWSQTGAEALKPQAVRPEAPIAQPVEVWPMLTVPMLTVPMLTVVDTLVIERPAGPKGKLYIFVALRLRDGRTDCRSKTTADNEGLPRRTILARFGSTSLL